MLFYKKKVFKELKGIYLLIFSITNGMMVR